jgi:DNA-binding GntR family transcriptional regulator
MDPKSIAEAIRSEIETGALLPGTPLKQEALAARYGVSRQPVRLALNLLLASGMVARRGDRSLAVATASADDRDELTDLRIVLECEALRRSVPRLSDRDLRRARRLADELAEEEDPAAIEALDVRFHATLYGACGNDRLLRLIEELRRERRRVYATQPKPSPHRAGFARQHEALLAACETRDVDAVRLPICPVSALQAASNDSEDGR